LAYKYFKMNVDCNKVEFYKCKHKKRKRRKALFFLSLLFTFISLSFAYMYCVVNPVVVEATRHAIFSLSTSAVSDAIYDVLNEENITYEDLVNVQYDSEKNVTMVSLQTIRLNLIARKFYQVAQVYLDNMGKKGIDVALGTFTGLPFLNGIGPKINLKLVQIGAMTSTFKNNFISAGINQTNHSLYIHLYASVSLILPAYTTTIDSVTEMLVAESVLVGKVPEVYFGSNSPLNFSPK